MIDGGPVDVLTDDWLAELTMGVLAKQQRRNPDAGYARTFLTQLDDVLADCLDRGVKVVSNAGGLNPHGCAAEVTGIAERIGRTVRVAVVDGDDVTATYRQARAQGWTAPHLDTGQPLSSHSSEPEIASAYLGGWAITEALAAGADVVITGRVTDATIILGPAAWHFDWKRDDWKRDDWDALAGAVAAGHVIECGACSDVGAITTRAVRDGEEHVVTGGKTYITSGTRADFTLYRTSAVHTASVPSVRPRLAGDIATQDRSE